MSNLFNGVIILISRSPAQSPELFTVTSAIPVILWPRESNPLLNKKIYDSLMMPIFQNKQLIGFSMVISITLDKTCRLFKEQEV